MLTEQQQNILRGFGNRIVQSLKEKLSDRKINASGELSASIRYEVDEAGMTIYAVDYVVYANYGRKPGKFPPPDAIKQWIDDKHLTFEIPKDSLAFLIGRKISEKGIPAKNFIEEVITDELIIEIQKTFAGDFLKQIKSEILAAYKIAA